MDLLNVDTVAVKTMVKINISYYKEYVMLAIPEVFTQTLTTLDKKANVLNEATKIDTIYRYHIYKKDEMFGTRYDSINATKGNVFSVDSLLKLKAFKGGKYYDIEQDSLINRETIKDNLNSKVLRYAHKNVTLPKAYDSLILFSSNKFKDIKYSFSDPLDQMVDSKVYKIVFKFNQSFKQGSTDILFPERKIVLGFKSVQLENYEQLTALFKRHIQIHASKEKE
ncbi:hypothetical protein FBD94_09730 [Pedobacter hiemivivus]|uniref:Uncharacterized protein n=1 Tax=Pedobacter hiemivivus TaxID=2530454 RepID=A0A4U1GEG6_9SPHI|nr:hypothetical protein [Pedobacter hiemivivus]TKC62485.1 hypothetical protein FBD94_09730 [Pedobacter hiemivivus]